MKLVKTAAQRLDGFMNALTGLGTAARDKLVSTTFGRSARLTETVLENMYHDDDMAARIVEALPEEAMRKGWYLSTGESDDTDLGGEIRAHEKRLKFPQAVLDAAIWARCLGGAVIYLGIEDGQEEDQPVNENAIKTIRSATVIDRSGLQVATRYGPDSEKHGQPETYLMGGNLNQSPVQVGSRIHETRMIRFDGARTSTKRKEENDGWSESVLQKTNDALTGFSTGWLAVNHLMQDAAQGVFKIHGLADMITGGNKDVLQTRMEVVELGRSVARAIMLDAETEDFTREAYTFAGIPEILKSSMLRLAAAARQPVMVLMGQSPSGLNATGEGDIRLWYDKVQAYQTSDIEPAIVRFYELLFQASDFNATVPEQWEVLFNRLWQMTDSEQATLEKTTAEKDQIYIETGVLLPEEVALNRFTPRGFSADTNVDLDARQDILDAEDDIKKSSGEPINPTQKRLGIQSIATLLAEGKVDHETAIRQLASIIDLSEAEAALLLSEPPEPEPVPEALANPFAQPEEEEEEED